MKKFYYLVLSVVLLVGCHKDGADESEESEYLPGKEELVLSENRFEVPFEGRTISVWVSSNVQYTVTIPEDFRSWLSEEVSEFSAERVFAVSANEEPKVREGYVLFSGGSLTDTLWVVQATGVSKDYTIDASGNIELEMVYVEGGTFQMGATAELGDDLPDREKPVHSVTLSDYYIGKYEVTQGLWKRVMGTTIEELRDKYDDFPLFGKGIDYPMYYVSWEDASEFCTRLSLLTGKKYVLPTEAQWEYAARGGVKTQGYTYSGGNDGDEVAWHGDNSGHTTHLVGTKKANELGIYDMSGNVWEWCQDWYGSYSNEAQTDPVGPESGTERIMRGCDWVFEVKRVSIRRSCNPNVGEYFSGFRVVLLP